MSLRVKWLPLLAVVVSVGWGIGCGSSSPSNENAFTGDAHSGIDQANTRDASSSIDTSNVSQLESAWSVDIEGKGLYGSYASTPVIVNGVVYSQDLESNVQAIDLESGDVLWSKDYESVSHGPNGLAVADGHVYGATADEAFALDQTSGDEVWATPLGGSIDMAPGVDDGKVYISTVAESTTGTGEAGKTGTLWALDGNTGKKVWHFDSVPADHWGDPQNGGGGFWYPPSFDSKGFVYGGTGNPTPLQGVGAKPWGASRPGPNLYTSSMVKLDPDTGKLVWYYQQTPHNLYDWDFQDSPILVKAGGRDLAIGAGKSGVVVAVDSKTGKPVWKRPVGTHNGHDDDGLHAMRGEIGKIETGEAFPGTLGGVVAPMASDGKRVYVPVLNHSMTVSASKIDESTSATGEIVAIDVATGKVAWKAQLATAPLGALLVVNDLVFATTQEGTIRALEAASGGEVWQAELPVNSNAGVMVSGDTLVTGAGFSQSPEEEATLVAYKLAGNE